MDEERYQHLKSLVEQALDMEPEYRRTFLETVCGGEPTRQTVGMH